MLCLRHLWTCQHTTPASMRGPGTCRGRSLQRTLQVCNEHCRRLGAALCPLTFSTSARLLRTADFAAAEHAAASGAASESPGVLRKFQDSARSVSVLPATGDGADQGTISSWERLACVARSTSARAKTSHWQAPLPAAAINLATVPLWPHDNAVGLDTSIIGRVVPIAEDLWDTDFTAAEPQSSRCIAGSMSTTGRLLDHPGTKNGRKRQAASAPAAVQRAGVKQPRGKSRSQPQPGEEV